jgi:hypothetical protein
MFADPPPPCPCAGFWMRSVTVTVQPRINVTAQIGGKIRTSTTRFQPYTTQSVGNHGTPSPGQSSNAW